MSHSVFVCSVGKENYAIIAKVEIPEQLESKLLLILRCSLRYKYSWEETLLTGAYLKKAFV